MTLETVTLRAKQMTSFNNRTVSRATLAAPKANTDETKVFFPMIYMCKDNIQQVEKVLEQRPPRPSERLGKR